MLPSAGAFRGCRPCDLPYSISGPLPSSTEFPGKTLPKYKNQPCEGLLGQLALLRIVTDRVNGRSRFPAVASLHFLSHPEIIPAWLACVRMFGAPATFSDNVSCPRSPPGDYETTLLSPMRQRSLWEAGCVALGFSVTGERLARAYLPTSGRLCRRTLLHANR